ncbi:universal stress protein [Pseudomonadota bacterium]
MSTQYTHILLATDLLDDNSIVVERAQLLARQNDARLSLIHAVESIPIYFGNEMVLPETQEIEAQLLDRAEKKMAELVGKLTVEGVDTHVVVGITKLEVISYAEQQGVDLIVIGSHSRHGLGHLLGSTARSVLNAAPCDVMAVKIKT